MHHPRIARLLCVLLLAACGGGSGAKVVVVGARAEAYRTLADFLDDPLVQDLIARSGLSVHLGSAPPPLEGFYDLELIVEMSDFDEGDVGEVTLGELCLFGQSGDRISMRDPMEYRDVFVTGTGDDFTIWFVTEASSLLGGCVATNVTILTGRLLPGGNLDAHLGGVLVGWYGLTCADYFDPAEHVGAIIVAGAETTLTGPACE
jgi:hypothetical protein